jgi:hypothetical protein
MYTWHVRVTDVLSGTGRSPQYTTSSQGMRSNCLHCACYWGVTDPNIGPCMLVVFTETSRSFRQFK